MQPSESITFLRRYNAWRRGDESEQPQPYQIGQAIDALCDHAERLERELEQVKTILADPLAVHINMMRGTIKWTPANLRHLLGDSLNDTPAQIDAHLDECVARSERDWKPLEGDAE